MILQKNGLLPIIVFDGGTTWNDLLDVAAPHLDASGLSKLKIALEASVQSVAVERHYIDKDYRDTFTNYHAKRFSTPDSRCVRLHFFRAPIDHQVVRDPDAAKNSYLGYSVIRPTRPNCVGRTLLDPGACGAKGAHLSRCEE